MTKKIFISSILLIFSFNLTFGCTCGSNKSFLRTISNAKVVALIKVKQFLTYNEIYDQSTPMSMEVEIIELYKGNLSEKKITIWGDNGILCRPYLDSYFKEGEFYIVGLFSGGDGSKGYVHKNERIEDFSISSCGRYILYLNKEKDRVYGEINSFRKEMKFETFKNKLLRKLN